MESSQLAGSTQAPGCAISSWARIPSTHPVPLRQLGPDSFIPAEGGSVPMGCPPLPTPLCEEKAAPFVWKMSSQCGISGQQNQTQAGKLDLRRKRSPSTHHMASYTC